MVLALRSSGYLLVRPLPTAKLIDARPVAALEKPTALPRRPVQHPARHRLMEVDRAGLHLSREHVAKAGALQRPVWSDVERVRLAVEVPQVKRTKVRSDRELHQLRTQPGAPIQRIDDVEMHEGLLAVGDLIARAEADDPSVKLPRERVVLALANRSRIVGLVDLEPRLARWQQRAVDAKHQKVLVGGVVEVVDADLDLVEKQLADAQVIRAEVGAVVRAAGWVVTGSHRCFLSERSCARRPASPSGVYGS